MKLSALTRCLLGVLLLFCVASVLTAQSPDPKVFGIDFPENEDALLAFDNLQDPSGGDLKLQFEGHIGTQGRSIRVIWTSGNGEKKDDYTLGQYKPGDLTFVYNVSAPLKNLDWGGNRYRFIATFKDGTRVEKLLTLYVVHGHMGERAKPIIYVYPTSPQDVTVVVSPPRGVTVSEPVMGTGWHVLARPDGQLVDKSTGKVWKSLFWESKDTGPKADPKEGFVVSGAKVHEFFQAKLRILGLEDAEIADFEAFWVPRLSANPYNYIWFHPRSQIDADAPLTVTPTPETIIRVYFEYESLTKPRTVREQVLVPVQRKGYSVVEWGGRLP